MQEILLNIESKEIRYALLKNGVLYDLIVERRNERQMAGNIYKGYVTNTLKNIQSAFIQITEGENGFIHISDIVENSKRFAEIFDLDFEFDSKEEKKEPKKEENIDIETIMKPGQPVLVQVVKEPMGTKGARLTSNVSIAGRYLVLLPNSNHRGVSRKIEDKATRDRLKRLIRSFEMPQDMGLICRTASAMVTPEILIEEATDLLTTWQGVMDNFQKATKPTLLYAESDIVKRALTTAIDKGMERLLVDDYNTFQSLKKMFGRIGIESSLKLEYYRDKMPMFERFNVEKEIEKSLRRKIWLSSGGYLFFDRTEAMHTIDVNSGRSSGGKSDVEETLVRINLEAAEEIGRQLRLRNIGGLIVCDFIDMRLKKNQRRVLDRLKDCMKEDSAKCTILGMSEFGLVEMTRQRTRGSLGQTFFTHCPYCSGNGLIKTHESISIEMERALKKAIFSCEEFAIKVVIHPELSRYMDLQDKKYLKKWAESLNARVEFEESDALHLNDFHIYSLTNKKKLEV